MAVPLQPGELLRERYIIREIIGRGGMGSIFQAEDNRLPGRLCAVKEVEPGQDLPDEMREQGREQFYREASVLARLDHPNLPKVSDFFTEEERDYLVMDFVPGPDLKSLMDEAREANQFLRQSDVLGWAEQLADALIYMHSQDPPVIHRDIKPSNLKLTPSGLIKLVDFGLVKQMVPDEMTVTVIQGRGTARYTPLEQYGGDTGHTDPRTDIYAFGAMLYHLLTNHAPTEAKQRFLFPGILQPPRELNPGIHQNVESAILWAMALHPDDRPEDIQTFREGLLGTRRSPLSLNNGLRSLPPATRLLPTNVERLLAGLALLLFLVAVLASL